MSKFKKICCLAFSVLTVALGAGCGDAPAANTNTGSEKIANFNAPRDGEDIVVLTIANYGDVKIKLFEDLAPKGSQNFRELTAQGYYDGLTFHRIISQFMIQGGDPMGTGTGGESIWGGKFDGGIPKDLYHFTGAVAYANSGSTSTNGSQFYIVVNKPIDDAYLDGIEQQKGTKFDAQVREKYKEVGGEPFLDGDYTVFGQVIEGMEIVEEISKVPTGQGDAPKTPVVILKAAVTPAQADPSDSTEASDSAE
ncbi:MAG: peptidylprolyl isomerase [Oscillospiraceae bacterium]|jgi:cyclophilin family peptidyl-prolyl cis-trans isomerase|nr:peptidylprolyl isomerase [Oscillospiraceae bacterium]